MNAVLLALIAVLAPAANARGQAMSSDGARPITLDDAVRLAQRNAPAAVQARGQERQSRANVRGAYAAFIPNITASLGRQQQFLGDGVGTRTNAAGERVELANDPTYNSGLAFSVDLFDGGRRFYELSAARAGVGAADATALAQQFTVALSVNEQYFNALAARESQAAARAQLEQAQQQFRASVARVAAGVATMSDSLRSVIQVGNARLALLTAENELRSANAALTRLVGSETIVTADPADTLPGATAATIDSAELSALALRGPAVRQAEANLAAARVQRRSARAPYLPSISASYSRNGNGFGRFGLGDNSYAYNGSLSFRLSYPLFNQLTREVQVVRADIAEDVAEAQARDARLLATQTLTQTLGAVRTAQERVEIQQSSVAAAVEDLRVQQQRYAVGASTLLDVLTSQTQLNQARSALIGARYDLRVARAQIEALVGRRL